MEKSDGIGEKARPALCITMKLPAITQFLLTVAAGHYIVKLLGNEPPRHTKHDAAAHFFQKASQSPRPPAEDPGSVSRTLFSWRNIRLAPSIHRRRSWGCQQPQTKHIKARRAFLGPCGQDSGPLSKAERSESAVQHPAEKRGKKIGRLPLLLVQPDAHHAESAEGQKVIDIRKLRFTVAAGEHFARAFL